MFIVLVCLQVDQVVWVLLSVCSGSDLGNGAVPPPPTNPPPAAANIPGGRFLSGLSCRVMLGVSLDTSN